MALLQMVQKEIQRNMQRWLLENNFVAILIPR